MKKILLEVVIGGSGIISPQELPLLISSVSGVISPETDGDALVTLSGRLPVWAYGALVHYLHPFSGVATFEPRLGKGVIVASHVRELSVGDLVEIADAERRLVEFQPTG